MAGYEQYIVRDPSICGGQPVIRGTRITLRTILASLAEGDSAEQLREAFPTLPEEALQAILAGPLNREKNPSWFNPHSTAPAVPAHPGG